jgi:hypothetical protein
VKNLESVPREASNIFLQGECDFLFPCWDYLNSRRFRRAGLFWLPMFWVAKWPCVTSRIGFPHRRTWRGASRRALAGEDFLQTEAGGLLRGVKRKVNFEVRALGLAHDTHGAGNNPEIMSQFRVGGPLSK